MFLRTYRDDLYSPIVLKKLKNGLELPRPLYLSLISDIRFYDLYSRLTHYSREVNAINANRRVLGDDLTYLLLSRTNELESGQISIFSMVIYTILEDRLRELERIEEQASKLWFELLTSECSSLDLYSVERGSNTYTIPDLKQ